MEADDDAVVGHDQAVFITVHSFQGYQFAVLLIDVDGLDAFSTSGSQTVFAEFGLLAVTVLGYDEDIGTVRILAGTDDEGAVHIHAAYTGSSSSHRTYIVLIEVYSLSVGGTDDDLVIARCREYRDQFIIIFQGDGDLAGLTDRFKFGGSYSLAGTVFRDEEEIAFEVRFLIDRYESFDLLILFDVDDIDDRDTLRISAGFRDHVGFDTVDLTFICKDQ